MTSLKHAQFKKEEILSFLLVEYLLPFVITTILTQLHEATWGASFQDLSTHTTILSVQLIIPYKSYGFIESVHVKLARPIGIWTHIF